MDRMQNVSGVYNHGLPAADFLCEWFEMLTPLSTRLYCRITNFLPSVYSSWSMWPVLKRQRAFFALVHTEKPHRKCERRLIKSFF